MTKKLPVPHPVSINEVCSECGELWALHPIGATLVDCVRLLKMKPSTTIVTSPCNCWCHHTITVTPWINPTPYWPPIYTSSDSSSSTDLQITVSSSA